MSRMDDPLDGLQIASPCRASWEAMSGNDQVRFCQHCEKNVYNLSGMSHRQAEALVRESEGRLCVRFYRRRDGTVLTDNCPVGLRLARRRLLTHLAGFSSLVGGVLAFAQSFVHPVVTRVLPVRVPPATVERAAAPLGALRSPVTGASQQPADLPMFMGEAPVRMGRPAPGAHAMGKVAIRRRPAAQVQVEKAASERRQSRRDG